MKLWDSNELCDAIYGKSRCNDFWSANSISIDTRSIKKGGVFFALKGSKIDGHEFIEDAFKNGAVAAVVNKSSNRNYYTKNIIEVDDTYKALERLGITRRKITNSKLIGVTGSVGKTTVKDFLYSILSKNINALQMKAILTIELVFR